MKRLLAAIAVLTSAAAYSHDDPSKDLDAEFAHYGTGPLYSGRPARPKLGNDRLVHEFRTIIREEAKAGVNFAGHYRLIEIGCGSDGCLLIFLIDIKTGRMKLSFTRTAVSNTAFLYSPNSRLVLFWRYEAGHCKAGRLVWTGSSWRRFSEMDVIDKDCE